MVTIDGLINDDGRILLLLHYLINPSSSPPLLLVVLSILSFIYLLNNISSSLLAPSINTTTTTTHNNHQNNLSTMETFPAHRYSMSCITIKQRAIHSINMLIQGFPVPLSALERQQGFTPSTGRPG